MASGSQDNVRRDIKREKVKVEPGTKVKKESKYPLDKAAPGMAIFVQVIH